MSIYYSIVKVFFFKYLITRSQTDRQTDTAGHIFTTCDDVLLEVRLFLLLIDLLAYCQSIASSLVCICRLLNSCSAVL